MPSGERIVAAEMLGIIGTVNEIPMLKSIWQQPNELTEEKVGLTALRAAEQIALSEVEKRVERERALEETRAFIAHEFRHAITPLNAYVKMLDEAVAEPELDKEKVVALITRIRKQTDAAFDLVNTYLDYSRPLVPQFTGTDINDVLQHRVEEFKFEVQKRKIVLSTQFADQVQAEVDRAMLVQAVRNIISNAIEAIDHDGVLVITTAINGNMVSISIRDTGTGIKPEHPPHVFEVGFSTKSKIRGAGVGLALSRRIIEEAHSGSITISNNADSSGATVLISLPVKQMERKNGRHTSQFVDS